VNGRKRGGRQPRIGHPGGYAMAYASPGQTGIRRHNECDAKDEPDLPCSQAPMLHGAPAYLAGATHNNKVPADPGRKLDPAQWEELLDRAVIRLMKEFPVPGELHEIACELRQGWLNQSWFPCHRIRNKPMEDVLQFGDLLLEPALAKELGMS
jgi:hypothetical protein